VAHLETRSRQDEAVLFASKQASGTTVVHHFDVEAAKAGGGSIVKDSVWIEALLRSYVTGIAQAAHTSLLQDVKSFFDSKKES
jgi:hypothetical protein